MWVEFVPSTHLLPPLSFCSFESIRNRATAFRKSEIYSLCVVVGNLPRFYFLCVPSLLVSSQDYGSFFARHALNNTYPGYRVPPGTQHYPHEM